MFSEDLVDLVFVTPHNFMYAYALPREEASGIIRSWFKARENVRCEGDGHIQDEIWLAHGTFAYNVYHPDDTAKTGATFALWSIGWEHVLGMYIRERGPAETDVQKRHAAAVEKMVKLLEKEVGQGNEWKGDEE